MAARKWKTPLTVTEHAIAGLWKEFDLCADVNQDHRLPFYGLRNPGVGRWNAAAPEHREAAELRYEAAGSIIDLFKCDRISYRDAVNRIQELFS